METVPARQGRAVRVRAGQALRIVNTHGTQVVDTWAFNANDPAEFMSMEHLRGAIGSVFPSQGDALLTNRRRPILMLERDTSPGRHDTVIAACDVHRYRALGCRDYHDNCTDNLHGALAMIGFPRTETPSPLNLWMNIPIAPDGRITWGEPLSKPGDYVILRAMLDCVIVLSACPQDMVPINGADCIPVEVHYELLVEVPA